MLLMDFRCGKLILTKGYDAVSTTFNSVEVLVAHSSDILFLIPSKSGGFSSSSVRVPISSMALAISVFVNDRWLSFSVLPEF
jgi:hypothetical protein